MGGNPPRTPDHGNQPSLAEGAHRGQPQQRLYVSIPRDTRVHGVHNSTRTAHLPVRPPSTSPPRPLHPSLPVLAMTHQCTPRGERSVHQHIYPREVGVKYGAPCRVFDSAAPLHLVLGGSCGSNPASALIFAIAMVSESAPTRPTRSAATRLEVRIVAAVTTCGC